ncbi:methyltransferase [Alkalimarinus coralli]|uniref:methyltransferase n=1 Tax=Alkalimarinus coralli TaxID=2935863 RepID=UPI00202B4BBB|nr:methyltransferase [Alkalimarinus coralli]
MRATFQRLDHILIQYANIWRISPFSTPKPSWLNSHPALTQWLLALSDDDVDRLQGNDDLLCQQVGDYLPVAQEIHSLIQVPSCQQKQLTGRTYAWQRDVPGRKAEQIEAFAAATGKITSPLIEWCSGKLHLGRYLAEQFKVPVLGLEINANLVQQANQLACRMHSDARVEQCDVLDPNVVQKLNAHQHVIALHACGGLHASLLQGGVEKQVKRITLAPCCYHRFNQTSVYNPLSKAAKSSELILDSDDLRTAVRQSNTAPERERIKRKRLQMWRLGFDLLQRDIRGIDGYLPVPSLSVKLLDGDFRQFCEHVSHLKELCLPGGLRFNDYEVAGEKRFFEYSRYELVRMTFRRALELWLVLDRVMYLEEHGYRCELTQFCPTDLTPRNFLIDAVYTA